MMARALLAAILSLWLIPSAWAGFGEGLAAYESGDYTTALEEWLPIAEQGDARAQYNLGVMFYFGEGVQKDYAAAAEWYTKAAEQGNAAALRNIIKMYENGTGVTQDDEVAEMYRSKLGYFSSWDVEDFERREISTPSESYDDSKDDPEFSKWYREAIETTNCSYDDDAFKFGLRIQWAVNNRDIEALYSLVPTELRYGPRKKFALKHSFSELFSEEWRERILSNGPGCFDIPRFQFLAHGHIYYRQIWKTNENNLFVSTNEWTIITIGRAEIDELGKTPISEGWVYKGKALGSFCFSQDSWAGDGGDLPVDLSLCQKAMATPNVSIDEVGTITECFEDSRRCLKTSYNLFMKIPVQKCKIIAPNVSDNCMEIGLVIISAERAGSIGYLNTVTIYGIIKDPITDKVFMTPLVDFDSLNEALNYIDALEK